MSGAPSRAKKLIETFNQQIDAIDKQIDTLVCKLYNLTKEEIKIVEINNGKNYQG